MSNDIIIIQDYTSTVYIFWFYTDNLYRLCYYIKRIIGKYMIMLGFRCIEEQYILHLCDPKLYWFIETLDHLAAIVIKRISQPSSRNTWVKHITQLNRCCDSSIGKVSVLNRVTFAVCKCWQHNVVAHESCTYYITVHYITVSLLLPYYKHWFLLVRNTLCFKSVSLTCKWKKLDRYLFTFIFWNSARRSPCSSINYAISVFHTGQTFSSQNNNLVSEW